MALRVYLYPPLNTTVGRNHLDFPVEGQITILGLIEALSERFGVEFRTHLYDDRGIIIPAWCVFVNERPVNLNRRENLSTPLKDGDEVSFLLNLAGG